jgi:SWI/SNF-related matrix-associated actin-dependent regulator 1 of chromatin subfamily A
LINLEDIKGRSALDLLETYEGYNPYILGLKTEYIKNKKLLLTDTQSRYIIDNIDRDPLYINRVVNITAYLGEEIKNKSSLDFTPERILIEFMLAETDKAYHIYGKLTKKSESKLFWLPKTQVTDDPYFEAISVDVDFTKYNDILSLSNKKLYQHQEEGIKFLLSRNGCILADDMGLGKSIQSIIAAIESGAKKILVVCPSSTKINWEREINVFCNDTTIIDGKKFSDAKFTIINFDILKNFHTLVKKGKESETSTIHRELAEAGFDLCIIDEAHYLKNNDSIRGKIMVELSVKYNIKKVWLLTGTPVANRPMDFFNLLKIIKSPIAQNWKHYATRYCEGRKFFRTLKNGHKRQIWLTDGASNLEELASKTKNIVLRRLKVDVLDMPDKVITPMHHLLDNKQKAEYEYLWEEYILAKKALGKRVKEDQKDLVELILLRQFIAKQAIPYTIEMVENAVEMGRNVIVFTSFTEELNAIAEHFGKSAVKHNGPMTNTMKQKSVDSFQNNDKIKVFVGNIKSAGVGITLTEGTVVIFNSFDWVTGNNEQAEDRAFRIGQKNDVNVYYQLFDDTISTRMWDMLKNKKDVINTILGEKQLTEEEITELLIEKLYE